jgi:tRNA dimethylallyltransferase
VGGTGLYHKHALSTDPRLHLPPNPELRAKAETKTLSELQSWLAEIDSQALAEMTDSDRKNPRRLIRAIEKAAADPLPQLQPVDFPTQINQLSLGLELPLPAIESKIHQRVKQRFQQGALSEIEALRQQFSDRSLSVFSATGVKQIADYLDGEITQDQALIDWALREFQYAKRQLTWFRKQPPQAWLSADDPDKNRQASEMIYDWLG